MTTLSTIRALAAAIAIATMLQAVTTAGAYAATGRLAQVTASPSVDNRHWPRRPPCRNWHKICYPF